MAVKGAQGGRKRLFDTAETYGGGESEKILGRLVAEARESGEEGRVAVATKFQPSKWRDSGLGVREAMVRAALGSCERLGVSKVSLYQVHSANHPAALEEQAEGLADVVEEGLADSVGVSNFSAEELARVDDALRSRRGMALASEQVELSLVRQLPFVNGVVGECRRRGILPLAYSPLAMGRLTGKYSSSSPPQGRRSFGTAASWEGLEGLLRKLRSFGEPSRVALSWCVHQGALPLPGAKTAEQARDNLLAMDVSLSEDDVSSLSQLGALGSTGNWQHG